MPQAFPSRQYAEKSAARLSDAPATAAMSPDNAGVSG
jgi:hypothetical protein